MKGAPRVNNFPRGRQEIPGLDPRLEAWVTRLFLFTDGSWGLAFLKGPNPSLGVEAVGGTSQTFSFFPTFSQVGNIFWGAPFSLGSPWGVGVPPLRGSRGVFFFDPHLWVARWESP